MVNKNQLTQRQLIEKTHDTVVELKTVLLGVPGTADKGVVGEIKQIKLNANSLNNRHNKLSRTVYILIGVLIGSGILGGGIYTLLNG